MENKRALFQGVKVGDTFEVAGMEFIRFPDQDGKSPVVARDILFYSRFGDNNDLRSSTVLKRLQEEVLPKIEEAVGRENLCTIHTDLRTLDGLRPYGTLESLISLPTLDFYRDNVEIFDRYAADEWWWLATADSYKTHGSDRLVLCVAPSGRLGYNHYCVLDISGARPVLIFDSAIFGSDE